MSLFASIPIRASFPAHYSSGVRESIWPFKQSGQVFYIVNLYARYERYETVPRDFVCAPTEKPRNIKTLVRITCLMVLRNWHKSGTTAYSLASESLAAKVLSITDKIFLATHLRNSSI